MDDAYEKMVLKLYGLNVKKGMDFGLSRPIALDKALLSPSKAFPIVHIAGTNGKGSVSYKVAAMLEEAGYRVGLFTSPHISTYRERIRINGALISEKDAATLLSQIFSKGVEATFFEITTLLALKYFAEQKVDWAVLETGLGGRLDATNIVTPKVSVITSIAKDHAEFLGNSIEEITREKAGIIKPNIPVVIGPTVPSPYLPKEAEVHQVNSKFLDYEEENRAVAKEVVKVLGISENRGIEAVPFCRFEKILQGKTTYILDVAHNPQALTRLFQKLPKRVPVIVSLSKNKELTECLAVVQKEARSLHLASINHPRLASLEELVEALPCKESVHTHYSVQKAMEQAAKESDTVVICGSFFIMSDAREALGVEEPTDAFNLNEC